MMGCSGIPVCVAVCVSYSLCQKAEVAATDCTTDEIVFKDRAVPARHAYENRCRRVAAVKLHHEKLQKIKIDEPGTEWSTELTRHPSARLSVCNSYVRCNGC